MCGKSVTVLNERELGNHASPETAQGQRAALEMAPDLAAVVAAWPTLPEVIRAGILAMVKAAYHPAVPRAAD